MCCVCRVCRARVLLVSRVLRVSRVSRSVAICRACVVCRACVASWSTNAHGARDGHKMGGKSITLADLRSWHQGRTTRSREHIYRKAYHCVAQTRWRHLAVHKGFRPAIRTAQSPFARAVRAVRAVCAVRAVRAVRVGRVVRVVLCVVRVVPVVLVVRVVRVVLVLRGDVLRGDVSNGDMMPGDVLRGVLCGCVCVCFAWSALWGLCAVCFCAAVLCGTNPELC